MLIAYIYTFFVVTEKYKSKICFIFKQILTSFFDNKNIVIIFIKKNCNNITSSCN